MGLTVLKQGAARHARHLALAGAALLVLTTSGCSSFTMPYIPFIHPAPPDLTPARDSAENMVRLDAGLRTGCDNVEYIDKPPASVGSATSTAPQRWVAHTCQGELSYDVLTVQTPQGPVVKVLPVAGPLHQQMNPNTIPAEHAP